MDRKRAKELLPIIEAFANGEDVQIKMAGDWVSYDKHAFLDGAEYRIRPKKRTAYQVYMDTRHPDYAPHKDSPHNTINVGLKAIAKAALSGELEND